MRIHMGNQQPVIPNEEGIWVCDCGRENEETYVNEDLECSCGRSYWTDIDRWPAILVERLEADDSVCGTAQIDNRYENHHER